MTVSNGICTQKEMTVEVIKMSERAVFKKNTRKSRMETSEKCWAEE